MERAELRVLWVGEDERERELLRFYLERAPGPRHELMALGDPRGIRGRLAEGAVDCVLLSHAPPRLDAIALLGELCAPGAADPLPVPVIVLDAENSAETALRSLRSGAQDCASCARLTPEGLARSLRNAIEKGRLECVVRERQRELEASQRRQLEIKDELISNVSHELRTPLTAIQQFVTILLDEVPGPLCAEQREYLEIALRNARALRDLIEDLMEASRCQRSQLAIEPRVMNVEAAIEESAASLRAAAEQRQLRLSVHCAAGLPRVLADPARVRQIVSNLLENAIRFTPAGRSVRLVAAPARSRSAEADAGDSDRAAREAGGAEAGPPGFVAIAVEDEGCGIRSERVPLVFERLHQELSAEPSSRRGLGLGLYIARELVRGQGGEIWARSELGAGSRFVFTLPAFSLEGALRPLLASSWPAGPLALLAVRIALRGQATLEEPLRARLYRELLHGSAGEPELVLPRLPPLGGAREEFYAVAPGAHAAALARRLGPALVRAGGPETGGLAVEIRSKPLGLIDPGREPQARLRDLGARLGVLLGARRADCFSSRGEGEGSDILSG